MKTTHPNWDRDVRPPGPPDAEWIAAVAHAERREARRNDENAAEFHELHLLTVLPLVRRNHGRIGLLRRPHGLDVAYKFPDLVLGDLWFPKRAFLSAALGDGGEDMRGVVAIFERAGSRRVGPMPPPP